MVLAFELLSSNYCTSSYGRSPVNYVYLTKPLPPTPAHMLKHALPPPLYTTYLQVPDRPCLEVPELDPPQ